MIFNISLEDLYIRKEQIAAEPIDQYTGDCMDLTALLQIPEMLMPRLDSKETSCRLSCPYDHLCKGKKNTDQYTVDRAK